MVDADVMKEDAVPFSGLSFCYAAVVTMVDSVAITAAVVEMNAYGLSYFFSAAVDLVTETDSANCIFRKAKGLSH